MTLLFPLISFQIASPSRLSNWLGFEVKIIFGSLLPKKPKESNRNRDLNPFVQENFLSSNSNISSEINSAPVTKKSLFTFISLINDHLFFSYL